MRRAKRLIGLVLIAVMLASPLQIAAADMGDGTAETGQEGLPQNTAPETPEEQPQEAVNEAPENTSPEGTEMQEEKGQQESSGIQPDAQQDVPESVSKEKVIDYTYIEQGQIVFGEAENVVVSFLDKNVSVEQADIIYQNESGEEFTASMSRFNNGAALFELPADLPIGNYTITQVRYVENGIEIVIDLNSEGIEALFSVINKETESTADVETTVTVIDDNGNAREVSSLEEGLDIVADEPDMSRSYAPGKARTSAAGNTVVVLDPGHDNQHNGAYSAANNIREEVYTLQIAKACRAELQQYNGVEVYMTVEENGDSRWPNVDYGQCMINRVSYAKSKNADLFVSFHLNSAGATAARGVEVYISNYSKYNTEAKPLAQKIINELAQVGLSNRGVRVDVDYRQSIGDKYSDGNWVDDLSVIRNSTLSGFPSLLIEHGFISNSSDAAIIKGKTAEMGRLDAKAIAEHLNLARGPFGVAPGGQAVVGNKVVLTAYPQYIPSGYNQYHFIYYDGKTWREFNSFSSSTSFEWIPKEASESYILGMEAKNSAGDIKQYIIWSNYKVAEPAVNIESLSLKESQNGMNIQITPNVVTDSTALKYRYQIYDVGRNVWTTLIDNTTASSAIWAPSQSGTYWIHVVAVTPTGKEHPYTMGYVVEAERAYISSFTSDKSSITLGGTVNLKASYKTLSDGNALHQFLAYDGQYWSDITGSSKDSAAWTPQKSGNYLLCYQITAGSGRIYQSFLSVEVTGNEMRLYGLNASQMNSKGEISLSVNISTNDPDVTYTYQAYDMEKWVNIASSVKDKSVVWKPYKSGAHLLNIEAKSSDGQTQSYAMGYAVPELVKINSFSADKNSPQGIGNKITLNASASVAAGVEATYEYMYYDGKSWYSIDKQDSLKSAVWMPKSGGNYLLCFQIATKSGEVYQSFMGYDITEPFVTIQGINVSSPNEKGEIALNAVISTNDDNLKYTYKAYDMQKWSTISEDSTKKNTAWKPGKAGVYLLNLEVAGSTGKVYSYAMGCEVKDDLRITGLKLGTASPQAIGSDISLSGQVSTIFPDGLKYEYLVYDGKNWRTLSSSDSLSEVIWTPSQSGNYSLCFQVIDKTGRVLQWFAGYIIEPYRVNINGLTVGKINSSRQIQLSANVSTNDAKARYTFKAYDMSKWKTIAENSSSPSAVWTPEKEGTYLLYLEVTDREGKVYTYSMGCVVENNVRITSFSSDLKSPQKFIKDMKIALSAASTASYTDGLTYRYMVYDGKSWNLIKESNKSSDTAVWTPETGGDYLLCYQIETDSGRQINEFIGYALTDVYYIMGESSTNVLQMAAYFKANNPAYDKYTKVAGYDGVLSRGGAPTIEQFCQMYLEEARAEGVKAEVAFCQAMHETGYLKFGGDVKPDQYNFAGLGATGNGVEGNRFSTVREGIRAQIQHLKCYASTEPLNQPCVDQRWYEWLRGTAPTVEELSQKWAVGSEYGEHILNSISRLKQY